MNSEKKAKSKKILHFLVLRIKMRDEKDLFERPEEKHFPRRVKESPKIMHHLKKTILA